MKRVVLFLFAAMIINALSACGPAPVALTATATDRPMATYTPSATATSTPIPPIEGRLFFDMNGSGLPDEASFNYDLNRMNSPVNQLMRDYLLANSDTLYTPELIDGLQQAIDDYVSQNPDTLRDQMHPVLLKVIDDYVSAHPEIKDGDLITMDEPALPGYTACVKSDCDQTDAEGDFSIPNPGGASSASITITDPYADFPAWAVRYINNWKGPVIVSAYTKVMDAATMARLTTIPGCDIDLAALVCKLDGDTLQVRDQHLNDTSIIPIDKSTSIKLGADNEVGLMQGFLTLPFVSEQVPKPFIWNYFDIINNFWSDDAGKNTLSGSQDGIMLNFDGRYYAEVDWRRVAHGEHITGTSDSHPGVDYLLPIGDYIVSSLPTSTIFNIFPGNQTDPELRISCWFEDPANSGQHYESGGSHLNVILGILYNTVYRGQIIGLSGDSGIYPIPGDTHIQQDHFGLSKRVTEGWIYFDPFRTIITLNPIPKNYMGSSVSWWTSDNTPQFSR